MLELCILKASAWQNQLFSEDKTNILGMAKNLWGRGGARRLVLDRNGVQCPASDSQLSIYTRTLVPRGWGIQWRWRKRHSWRRQAESADWSLQYCNIHWYNSSCSRLWTLQFHSHSNALSMRQTTARRDRRYTAKLLMEQAFWRNSLNICMLCHSPSSTNRDGWHCCNIQSALTCFQSNPFNIRDCLDSCILSVAKRCNVKITKSTLDIQTWLKLWKQRAAEYSI